VCSTSPGSAAQEQTEEGNPAPVQADALISRTDAGDCRTGWTRPSRTRARSARCASRPGDYPVGAENSVTSCDLRIFLDQPTDPVPVPESNQLVT
jgi:hypothetical protein